MNKKKDIIDAAFELLRETGEASQLNLRKISRRAGCAHTNTYNYFKDFEGLKWAMLEQALEILNDAIFPPEAEQQDDALQLISRYIDFALENPELYKLIWITDLNPAAAPADTGFLKTIPDRLAKTFPSGKADIIHSYVHGKLLNIIFSREPALPDNNLKKIILDNCRKMI